MKGFRDLLEKRWFANTFALCVAVLLYMFLTNIPAVGKTLGWVSTLLTPVLIGAVIAYLLDPIVTFIEKKGFSSQKGDGPFRVIAVILAYIICGLAIGILVVLLVPSIISSVQRIYENLPAYQSSLDEIYIWVESLLGDQINTLWEYINEGYDKIITYLKDNATKIVDVSLVVGGLLFNVVIGLIISFYFLVGKKNIMEGVAKLGRAATSEKTYNARAKFFGRCHKILITFIGCDLLDAIIVGIVNAIIMNAFKMPFIPLVSVIVGVTNLIPTFGPFIGAALGGLVLLFSSPREAVIFLVFTLVLQIIDGYILKPRLFGSVLGVAPVWVLITLIIGGKLFGTLGILLAIPFAAIFTVVYNEQIIPALERSRDNRAKYREEKSKAQMDKKEN